MVTRTYGGVGCQRLSIPSGFEPIAGIATLSAVPCFETFSEKLFHPGKMFVVQTLSHVGNCIQLRHVANALDLDGVFHTIFSLFSGRNCCQADRGGFESSLTEGLVALRSGFCVRLGQSPGK